MKRPSLILASESPQRLSLLGIIDVRPAAVVPAYIDEIPDESERPRQYALRIAKSKAAKIKAEYPDKVVLAADTVVAKGRRILPKAKNELEARTSLTLLSGGWHCVYSAVVVMSNKILLDRVVRTRVHFKRLSYQELERYIETDEWRGKAGSYSIQGSANALIIEIRGSYSNVVGLPLFEVQSLLTGVGYCRFLC